MSPPSSRCRRLLACLLVSGGASCDAGGGGLASEDAARWATEVLAFTAGEGAGFGQDALPGVVLGPPVPTETGAASLDVVALGAGGEIVVGFGAVDVIDGEGADLVVFENPFLVGGNPATPFAELGEVSVSEDGTTWHVFDCDPAGDGAGGWPGCAGWRTVAAEAADLDPETSGGDPFDLAEVGLARARFVRIVDVTAGGFPPSVGFDLDAVGVVHGVVAR